MSLEENKALVRRFNKEAFDEGDLSAAERYLAADFLNHVSGKRGIEDMQRIIRYVRAAFPDGRQQIDQEIAEGDLVVQLITSTGTHTGEVLHMPWGPIAPTGKPVSWQSVRIYRIVHGKIAEHWAVRDDLRMLVQLGALPGARPPAN
ncbi:MAG TPA: ester cyclase [Candidatus Udaeobacter sp.]|nr:ester cyclase [Candidatus Udaeobacter sp.]